MGKLALVVNQSQKLQHILWTMMHQDSDKKEAIKQKNNSLPPKNLLSIVDSSIQQLYNNASTFYQDISSRPKEPSIQADNLLSVVDSTVRQLYDNASTFYQDMSSMISCLNNSLTPSSHDNTSETKPTTQLNKEELVEINFLITTLQEVEAMLIEDQEMTVFAAIQKTINSCSLKESTYTLLSTKLFPLISHLSLIKERIQNTSFHQITPHTTEAQIPSSEKHTLIEENEIQTLLQGIERFKNQEFRLERILKELSGQYLKEVYSFEEKK